MKVTNAATAVSAIVSHNSPVNIVVTFIKLITKVTSGKFCVNPCIKESRRVSFKAHIAGCTEFNLTKPVASAIPVFNVDNVGP